MHEILHYLTCTHLSLTSAVLNSWEFYDIFKE